MSAALIRGRAAGFAAGLMLLSACGPVEGPGADETHASAETTYRRYCYSCHASGAAGAPRLGDSAAWAPRIAQGLEVLVQHTVDGVEPGMPARGLCLQCSRDDLRKVVIWMIEQSGGLPEMPSTAKAVASD